MATLDIKLRNTCMDKFNYTNKTSQQTLSWQLWQACQMQDNGIGSGSFFENHIGQSNFTARMSSVSYS